MSYTQILSYHSVELQSKNNESKLAEYEKSLDLNQIIERFPWYAKEKVEYAVDRVFDERELTVQLKLFHDVAESKSITDQYSQRIYLDVSVNSYFNRFQEKGKLSPSPSFESQEIRLMSPLFIKLKFRNFEIKESGSQTKIRYEWKAEACLKTGEASACVDITSYKNVIFKMRSRHLTSLRE